MAINRYNSQVLEENIKKQVLSCIINDMIESQKEQIKYDLKRSNLEYILEFVDVDSYYDNVCYGLDLTDFEWEDEYSEFGLFYIKRL